MQRSMRRWPWWSPIRLLAAVMMLSLLALGVIAARDALARGLQVYLAAFAIGTALTTVVVAVGRPQPRIWPLLFGAGLLLAVWGCAGLLVSGLIWQGIVAFCVLAAAFGAPMMAKVAWPLRTMSDDEAQAYLSQFRAWQRANPPRDLLRQLIRRMRPQ